MVQHCHGQDNKYNLQHARYPHNSCKYTWLVDKLDKCRLFLNSDLEHKNYVWREGNAWSKAEHNYCGCGFASRDNLSEHDGTQFNSYHQLSGHVPT